MSHVSHIPRRFASRRPRLWPVVAFVVAVAIVLVLVLATVGAGSAPNSCGDGGGAGRLCQHSPGGAAKYLNGHSEPAPQFGGCPGHGSAE
jgi:hypothetical protein